MENIKILTRFQYADNIYSNLFDRGVYCNGHFFFVDKNIDERIVLNKKKEGINIPIDKMKGFKKDFLQTYQISHKEILLILEIMKKLEKFDLLYVNKKCKFKSEELSLEADFHLFDFDFSMNCKKFKDMLELILTYKREKYDISLVEIKTEIFKDGIKGIEISVNDSIYCTLLEKIILDETKKVKLVQNKLNF